MAPAFLPTGLRRPSAARVAAVGYAALAAADTALAASAAPERRQLRRLTKPLLMPALGSAFSASLTSRSITRGGLLRGGTVTAQALSGVGDIALLGSTRPAFLAGLASFLGAHVAYTAGFASTVRAAPRSVAPGHAGSTVTVEPGWTGVGVALAACAGLSPVLLRLAGNHDPALKVPVVAYTAAITTMFAAATRLPGRVPRQARRKVVAGSALFIGSDAILAARQFVLTEPPRWTDASVMATYTLGQGLIAAGVSEAIRALDSDELSSR